MANDDKSALRRTTPIGTADFPHLHKPDGKFAKGGAPTYTCKVYVAKDDKNYAKAVALRDELDAWYAEAVPRMIEEATEELTKKKKKIPDFKASDKPWGTDADRGIYFNPKMRAWFERDDERIEMRPGVYDSNGKEITTLVEKGKVKIGGGSKVRTTFLINEFVTGTSVGVSLRLEGVQLIELKSSGRDASSLGFDKVDGGFSGDDVEDSDGDSDGDGGKHEVDLDENDGENDSGDSDDEEYARKNGKGSSAKGSSGKTGARGK